MRNHRLRLLLAAGVLVATAGCATTEEWDIWRNNRAHFASGDHIFFSLRNQSGEKPRVTRQDIAVARDEGWWGKPITVSQAQILDR